MFLDCLQKYGNKWKEFSREFPERSLSSIKCKYHNEIHRMQHGIYSSNMFEELPQFNGLQGGRRMDKSFLEEIIEQPCIIGFSNCTRAIKEKIFRLMITLLFSDADL